MCKGDMTPIPVYWAQSINATQPSFETMHTCRNFKDIRDWIELQTEETWRLVRELDNQ